MGKTKSKLVPPAVLDGWMAFSPYFVFVDTLFYLSFRHMKSIPISQSHAVMEQKGY